MADFDAATRFAQAPAATCHGRAERRAAPGAGRVRCMLTSFTPPSTRNVSPRRAGAGEHHRQSHVCLLVHHYADDWTQLWVADGVATIHQSGEEMATGYALLRSKYVQYQNCARRSRGHSGRAAMVVVAGLTLPM